MALPQGSWTRYPVDSFQSFAQLSGTAGIRWPQFSLLFLCFQQGCFYRSLHAVSVVPYTSQL